LVADIEGVSARKMVEGLIEGKTPEQLAGLGLGQLKDKREALEASMEGELSPRHRLILKAAHRHLRYLEEALLALDRYLIEAMPPYSWVWKLLQTILGIDPISAAMTSPALARPTAWPPGPRFAPATMRVRVSARAANRATATPSCALLCEVENRPRFVERRSDRSNQQDNGDDRPPYLDARPQGHEGVFVIPGPKHPPLWGPFMGD